MRAFFHRQNSFGQNRRKLRHRGRRRSADLPGYRALACVFLEIGQDVHIEGNLKDAVDEGVRQGYTEGYLRKSCVKDPIDRVNTGDNTPAVIYYEIVPATA